ncbi:MAG: dicarboxylate/amino acid:cation symporter [Treponemataceae bacterium]|nr:dicarboxylate/amino acid:cation symporter [Treponemataceae bacterium]
MKIWIKYIIGCALGIIATFVFPADALNSSEFLNIVSDITIRCGRYILPALLFFSISVAVFQLLKTKMMLKTFLLTFLVIIVSSVILSLLGLASISIFKLPRIPILVDVVSENITTGMKEYILKLFPYSSFEVFIDGVFYLPVILFAIFAGAGCAADKNASKQAVSLFDSLSRVCFNILSIVLEIISVGLIALSCKWFLSFIEIVKTGIYNSLILLLLGNFIFIAFILYPLAIFIFCKEKHPYKILYASIAPVLTAFITGDSNISLAVSLKHTKDCLGIRRRANTISLPFFSVFARGGSALTLIISFIVILKSYSNLSISPSDILWLTAISCLLSFCLGSLPTKGVYTALIIICLQYGRGFEAGYLILKPVVPVICSFAAVIDVVTMIYGSYFTAHKLKFIDLKEFSKYE